MFNLQTVGRTLDLLSLFGKRPTEGWNLSELAAETGLNKASLLRMLTTLQEHRYLHRDTESKRYRLGVAALELGSYAAVALEVRRVAYPEMRSLTSQIHHTTLLHVPSLPDRICIEKIDGDARPPTEMIGQRGPLWAGSSGKVLLAFLPEAQRQELIPRLTFQRFTERTITDPTQLMREIETIRRQGYAVSHGELFPNTSTVAAPIWNRWGHLEAGLTLVGHGESWNPELWDTHIAATCLVANRISVALGYQPPNAEP